MPVNQKEQSPSHTTPPVSIPGLPPTQLPIHEGKLFYKLYAALCAYANGKLKVVSEEHCRPEQFLSLPLETRLKVRDALLAQPKLIDQFVKENPNQLTAEELAIVAGWQYAVIGDFYIFRYLQRHTVFLQTDNPPKAYGVLALASTFQKLVGPDLPVLAKAVLLPINGRIIYDGLLLTSQITFGPGIRRLLYAEFKRAQETFGIITSLPESSRPAMLARRVAKKKPTTGSGRAEGKAITDAIVELTDSFCRQYLNEEYADLCRELASTLARKRPSPLLRGHPNAWACGIIRTIGWVNFLDDSNQEPHLQLPFIDRTLGVTESTGRGKARTIRSMLKIRIFELKWTLPSRLDDNPRF